MVILLLALLTVVSAVEPTVNCSAPISPKNGQAFLYQEGQTVKYVCEPGYFIHGKEIVRCADGQWEHPSPICISLDAINDPSDTPDTVPDENSIPMPPSFFPPARPLFGWGGEELKQEPEPQSETEPVHELEEVDSNSTNANDDETPMSDEARMQLLLYPRRRVVTRRIRPARIQRGSDLEDEQKRRTNRADASSTTIHLQAPPSMIYVRRTQNTGKSDQSEVRRMAPLHMTVATNGQDKVQVLTAARAAVETQGDKGQQTDEALRHMYWWGHEYYPRQSQLLEYYRQGGSPVAMTISESQLAWIHSLHPELRDQYLRDIYGVRANEVEASARAQAYYYRYGDPYYYYHSPLHYREPVSRLIVEEPITSYDYTCHQAHSNFVKAPKLPNAHIARYDRRQNPNSPHNHYLSAVYRCDPGYVMYDTRYTELHCSQRSWIGPQPVCVPARG